MSLWRTGNHRTWKPSSAGIQYRIDRAKAKELERRRRAEQALEDDIDFEAWADGALLDFLRTRGDYIRLVAQDFAWNDEALQDDLVQEALIVSWELEPTRFNPQNDEDWKYLRTAYLNRMRRIRSLLRRQAGGGRDIGLDLMRAERLAERAVLRERRYNHIEKPWAWREETYQRIKAQPARRWRVNDDGTWEPLT